MLQLDDPVGRVPGVGPRREAIFRGAGILTVGDLLMVLPMRYEDRSQCVPIAALCAGSRQGVKADVLAVRRKGPPGPRRQVELRLGDDSGEVLAVWFNQPYMASRFERGQRLHLFGTVEEYKDALQLVNPVVADDDTESLHVGRPVPVYRRIGELGPGLLRRITDSALEGLGPDLGRLPTARIRELDLMPIPAALRELHYPPAGAELGQWEALRSEPHRTLVMNELVDFQVVLALQHRRAATEAGFAREIDAAALAVARQALPFELTAAQSKVLQEAVADLNLARPMHRLVQGDVGCGKTAVLGCAALAVARQGEQVAVLAPTEILVQQHGATLAGWAAPLGIDVLAMSGADGAAARRHARARLREPGPLIVVGTHALLEPEVQFARLGLVVVDEQHRFGVGQRAALRAKGERQGAQPDLLVTTATPIPRSLALTLYGDLQVSRIDEMPPGRSPVRTRRLERTARDQVAGALRQAVADDGRAFVVAPAIEHDDESDGASVAAIAAELAQALPDVRIGILHGRLDAATKARAVADFVSGTTPVLVATTVIEVGVDVPSATLMVVDQADRFGLAQLHQLRGRVGRGSAGGECWLLADARIGEMAAARLDTLCRTSDGFLVAEEDLRLRGAGELLGYRQTGAFGFRIANPRAHHDWLETAHGTATRLVDSDESEARAYRDALRTSWRARMRLVRAG